MLCPSCDSEVEAGAWICPRCDFILDASVLGGAAGEPAPRVKPPWSETTNDQPEAMILGDVNVDPEDFQVLPGAAADGDGRTTTFLFYTSGATSRVLRPDVVPVREEGVEPGSVPTTPYEDFILASIDGRRTIRDIQKTSGLAPQEVTITLLTLLDKRIVRIARPQVSPPPASSTVEEIPIAKPRHGSKKGKRKKSTARGLAAVKAPKLEVPVTDDALPAVTPSALDPEDQDEVTEWSGVPRTPTAAAPLPSAIIGETGRDLSRNVTPIPMPQLSSGIFASARAAEQEIERAEDETADSTVGRPLGGTPPPKQIEVVVPPPLPRGSTAGRQSAATPKGPESSKPPEPKAVWSADRPERAQIAEVRPERADPRAGGLPAPGEGSREPRLLEPASSPSYAAMPTFDTPPPMRAVDPPSRPPVDPAPKSTPEVGLSARPPPIDTSAPMVRPQALTGEADDRTSPPRSVPSTLPKLDPSFLTERHTKAEQIPAEPPAKKKPIAPPPPSGPSSPATPAFPKKPEPIKVDLSKPASLPPSKIESTKPERKERPIDRPRADGGGPDGHQMAKAAKLFAEALKQKAEGNMVSARMNMKLAMTFDQTNPLYVRAYEDLIKGAPGLLVGVSNVSKARELYDKATMAERLARHDEAIELLEQALVEHKDPAVYNRLGVLLAMKKNEFARAQELIEIALEMSPGNSTYQHNLSKVLQRAATHELKGREGAGAGKKKEGLLGSILGRKK